jgi:leucyl aminopeptidase
MGGIVDIHIVKGMIQDVEADAVVLNLFEGQSPGGATGAVDRALSGMIGKLVDAGDVRGKLNEVTVLYPSGALPARRVILVGLGKAQEFTLDRARQAAGSAATKARSLGCKSIATMAFGAGAGQLDPQACTQATVEGALLGLYEFRAHKSTPAERSPVESLTLVEADPAKMAAVEAGARVGRILAEATNLTRDLVNQPSNHMTPHMLADTARVVASQNGLQCQVLGLEQMAELNMGALMGVTKGSDEPPQFIILEHRPDAGQPVIFVGKGITFDSGGISIKPSEHMEDMKSDMAGAATVVGAMQAVARLDLPVHVIGLAPACENLPSGHAYKPGDVLKAMNGKTIEIISTDAEGRLILADALCYAARYNPAAVIDLATLTGACVVALGDMVAAGIFCNDDGLSAQLREAGAQAGEKLWPLPLYEEYKDKIKSEVADMKNTGGRSGGVGTSAIFLKEFTSYPWAHLDIAAMDFDDKGGPYQPKGATGFGVRTLVEFLRQRIGS